MVNFHSKCKILGGVVELSAKHSCTVFQPGADTGKIYIFGVMGNLLRVHRNKRKLSDIKETARIDLQRGDDAQRHETQTHHSVDIRTDIESPGRGKDGFLLPGCLSGSFCAHEASHRESKRSQNTPLADQGYTAVHAGHGLNGRCHVLIGIAGADDVMRIMSDTRRKGSAEELPFFDVSAKYAQPDLSAAFVALDNSHFAETGIAAGHEAAVFRFDGHHSVFGNKGVRLHAYDMSLSRGNREP